MRASEFKVGGVTQETLDKLFSKFETVSDK